MITKRRGQVLCLLGWRRNRHKKCQSNSFYTCCKILARWTFEFLCGEGRFSDGVSCPEQPECCLAEGCCRGCRWPCQPGSVTEVTVCTREVLGPSRRGARTWEGFAWGERSAHHSDVTGIACLLEGKKKNKLGWSKHFIWSGRGRFLFLFSSEGPEGLRCKFLLFPKCNKL